MRALCRWQSISDDDAHMIEHFSHLPNPPADPLVAISAMNALMEGFAYTWLVVNPSKGQTIPDEAAIDVLTTLLHHGLTGGK